MSHVTGQVYALALPRLGTLAFALTGAYPAAVELLQAAVAKAMSGRRPRDAADAALRIEREMGRLHARGYRERARWTVEPSPLQTAEVSEAPADPLAALPPTMRTVVVMSALTDHSTASLAKELHLSESEVAALARAGHERLAAMWGVALDAEVQLVRVKVARS